MVVYSLRLNYDAKRLRFKPILLELNEKQIFFIMGSRNCVTVREYMGYAIFRLQFEIAQIPALRMNTA